MVFLLAALGLFVAFHFLPSFRGQELGWHIWPRMWRYLQEPKHMDSEGAVFYACFLNLSLLIVVSPFLKDVLHKSKLARWGAVIFSDIAGTGFWVMFLIGVMYHGYDFKNQGVGLWCLLFAPVLNFIGLLLTPRKSSESIESAG